MKHVLTEGEKRVLGLLNEAWTAMTHLPIDTENERPMFLQHVTSAQNLVMCRLARRVCSDEVAQANKETLNKNKGLQ